MKKLVSGFIVSASLCLIPPLVAHDEGHGPKLTDPAQYGGKVAPVIFKSDVSKGRKATMHFKAEVTKNASGKMRVYLYDTKMVLLDKIAIKQPNGIIYYKDKKTGKGKKVTLKVSQQKSEIYTQLPKEIRGKFDFDFTFETDKGAYFVAFDGMR